MASDPNGFDGHNKAKVIEQISNSTNWTAYARVASVLSAPLGVIILGLMAWNFSTLIEVGRVATRTEAQLEDFKQDAERSRSNTKEALDRSNENTKERLDALTAWVARLSQRIDNLPAAK